MLRLTKHGHACVRLQDGDRTLVIDPGVFSAADSLSGADAVLVTHEHADHIDVDRLVEAVKQNPALTVHTHPALAADLSAALAATLGGAPAEVVTAVSPGDTFTAAGFSVQAVGGLHAEIIDGLPGCPNVGFVVAGVYHPGDSLHVPTEPVDTLLVPAAGPWLKLREAIELVRTLRPARTFPIHDAALSALGTDNFDGWLEDESATSYSRIPQGGSVTLTPSA